MTLFTTETNEQALASDLWRIARQLLTAWDREDSFGVAEGIRRLRRLDALATGPKDDNPPEGPGGPRAA